MKANMNDYVVVRLNDFGVSILRDNHEQMMVEFPMLNEFVEPIRGDDGFYTKKMQLWDLMNTFGCYINVGFEPPFSTDIEVQNDRS